MKSVLIVGGGGVLGTALAAEFATAGYRALSLRRPESIGDDTKGMIGCDLADSSAVQRAAEEAQNVCGAIDVVVHNAAHFEKMTFTNTDLSAFELAWRVSVASAAASLRVVLPHMVQRRRGVVIFSGATASIRGGAGFSAFASAKFALRGLAQALAREYQAVGIHVAHVILDGLLRGSPSIARLAATSHRPLLDPREVAAQYRALAEQPPTAWSDEVALRPMGESF
ncbi:MAG TPA: SDR family NAD(P)-dependent oxidoreductase [Steroidobacteraceae bacterium]|nr:SDR family NAD(P)-dependent oxidoreductase [Steroidobacteraceae bacterium]